MYWEIYTGDAATNIKELHDRYGDTVRVSPTALSFNNSQAWRGVLGEIPAVLRSSHADGFGLDIYGHRQGRKQIPKDREVYFGGGDGVADIIGKLCTRVPTWRPLVVIVM